LANADGSRFSGVNGWRLFGIFLKEYFFSRSFEQWKQQQTLETLFQKYQDPLVLAARELASRTLEIGDDYPAEYLRTSVLASRQRNRLRTAPQTHTFDVIRCSAPCIVFARFWAGWNSTAKISLIFILAAISIRGY
jgi:hypothetical protein